MVALVPRADLDDAVRARARQVASERLGEVTTTMAPEAQAAPDAATMAVLEDLEAGVAAESGLWCQPG